MDFNNCKVIYKSSNVKIRRLIEGSLIDSIPTIDGNKSFSKVDPINLKEIIKEARLTDSAKQKGIASSKSDQLIPQSAPPNLLINNPRPTGEEGGLGSTVIQVDGQHIRRSQRLYNTSTLRTVTEVIESLGLYSILLSILTSQRFQLDS